MMRGQDFNKFRALVAKKEGRTIESIQEYPDFPGGMAMRYVDETTTFIYGDSAHIYRHKGIFITIQKCRNIPGNKYKAKLANGIEKVIAYASTPDISSLGRKKQMVIKGTRLIIKVLGKGFVFNKLMAIQDKLVKSGSGYLAYVRPMKDNINISTSMFTKLKRVELEGTAFLVPSESGSYLEKVYGKKWKDDKKPEGISARHLLVASTQVSYKEIDTDGSLYADRSAINKLIETRKTLSNQIKTMRVKIEKYWDILFLTQERYRLYRRYKPVLDILNEHLAKKEYAWLTTAMQDYLSTVKLYASKGWPVVVCPELDKLALELLYYSGDLAVAQKFKSLKSNAPLKEITLELDAQAREEALQNLPATITVDEENVISVFLHDGENYRPVVRLDEKKGGHPVLLKSGNKVVCAPSASLTTEDGDIASSFWPLAVEETDGVFMPLFSSQWKQHLFEDRKAIPLVQHIYGRDLELAWLATDGRLYVTSQFASCNRYTAIDAPKYCAVTEDLEVPVSFMDDCGALHALSCMDKEGNRAPVVTLGAAGSLWVTPGAGNTLYYLNDDGQPEHLSVNRYLDEAAEKVKVVLHQEQEPKICCKLVQLDAFGRVLEIAALCNDESLLPLARMNADGTLSALAPQKQTYSTLCLKQSDGTTITLATIDSDGKVISSLPDGQNLPIGVAITHPLN